MKVLGIDISSVKTGWALIDEGTLVKYGYIDVKKFKNPTANNSTLFLFGNEIQLLLNDCTPDYVAVENLYAGPNPKTLILLGMLSGIARYFSYSHTAEEVLNIMPSEVNKLVGIPSRGVKRPERKKAIISGINKMFNLQLLQKDDDLADAMGLAYVAYLTLKSSATPRYI